MRSPSAAALRLCRTMLVKECRELLRTKSFWTVLALLSLLTGYSFIQAVRLYAEASRSALPFPEMSRAMTPVSGVLVPTFGAYYLAATFLFPLIAIRPIGSEKQSGSIKLLLQLPLSAASLVAVKAAAAALAWLVLLLPGLSAVAAWRLLGGHVFWPEAVNLVAGHCLNALAVAGISFLAAAATDSTSTAAVAALAGTASSWVLDFAAGTEGALAKLSFLSLTTGLKAFERGILSLDAALQFAIVGLALSGLAVVCLAEASVRRKAAAAVAVLSAAALLWGGGLRLRWSRDVSEDGRNSFNPAAERALRRMDGPLTIVVRLSADDSRLTDLERNILDKMRRAVPRLTVVYASRTPPPPQGRDDYGLISYEYAGKRDESRSNSEEEILPILFGLSGQSVAPEAVPDYPGYPLVASAESFGAWFYLVLPAACLLGAWINCRGASRRA